MLHRVELDDAGIGWTCQGSRDTEQGLTWTRQNISQHSHMPYADSSESSQTETWNRVTRSQSLRSMTPSSLTKYSSVSSIRKRAHYRDTDRTGGTQGTRPSVPYGHRRYPGPGPAGHRRRDGNPVTVGPPGVSQVKFTVAEYGHSDRTH
eukprot:756688-Hanusia_phi.AAC.1